MNKLKVAVIGAGHLGKIHAKLAKGNDHLEVVGVVEPVAAARSHVSTELQLPTYEDIKPLIGHIDAAIVATPTVYHYDVTSALLRAGVHVLVEKPLASSAEQADRLVQIARRHNLVLQVGHVERFNPSWTAVQPHLGTAKYIECVRAGAYSGRSTDIGVVHDLMIHDIDLVLSLVRSQVISVSACGIALLGQHEDLAEARVSFANGCIANFKASRVSLEATRPMSIFTTSSMAELDFSKNEVRVIKPSLEILDREVHLDQLSAEERTAAKGSIFGELFTVQTLPAEPRNAILDEQNDLARAFARTAPMVTGEDGTEALKLASQILEQIARHRWDGESSRPWQIGPAASPAPKILPMPAPGERKPNRKAG